KVPGKASFTGPTPGSHGTWKKGTFSRCHETLRQRTGRRESRRPDSLFPTARYQTSWKMIWRSRSCESTRTGVRPSLSTSEEARATMDPRHQWSGFDDAPEAARLPAG